MDARVSGLGIPVPKLRTSDMDTDGLGAARTFPIPVQLQQPTRPPLYPALSLLALQPVLHVEDLSQVYRIVATWLLRALPLARLPGRGPWAASAYYDYYVFYGCGLGAGCSVTHTHAPGNAQPGLGRDSAWLECKSAVELNGPGQPEA